jgi:hypothetical protein
MTQNEMLKFAIAGLEAERARIESEIEELKAEVEGALSATRGRGEPAAPIKVTKKNRKSSKAASETPKKNSPKAKVARKAK